MENIKSYLDGELDIAQKAEVETHLHNDAELQKMVEEFSAISTTLKTADSGEPYGLDKLEERLKEGPKVAIYEKKKIWRTAINWSAGSACVVLIAFFMFPVFAQSKDGAKRDMFAFRDKGSGDATASAATPSDYYDNTKKKSVDEPTSSDDLNTYRSSAKAAPSGGPMRGRAEGGAGGSAGGFKGAGVNGDVQAQVSPETETPSPSYDARTDGKAPDNMKSENTRTQLSKPPTSEDELLNGHRAEGKVNATEPNGQWYEKTKSTESPFKAGMRAKRDGVTQAIPGVPETDHGIYLERSGQMQVKVEDLKRAVNEATGMVVGLDGFVTASNTQNQADGGVATMTLRIPTKNFATAIDKLEAMGELISENTGSLDITKPTVDNSARMISWADEEKRLIEELAKAKNNDQRWRIRGAISNARVNLEAHKAEVNSLLERAKYSTLELNFVRGDKAAKAGGPGNWSGSALRDAKDNLSGVGQILGTFAIYILVFSPIWLPFAIAGYVIRKKTK